MADIMLLDSTTIDKIAAGEVVEKPVNVVKELVENSIDGNATIINIEIKDGGKELIRVTDNGQGIKPNQVKTAFLRHATSKLSTITDLESISSLGFRGEALSSISAVSKTEMITKTSEALLGTHICIDGGKLSELNEVGAPNGTTVIVRQLFYNTPARKKFLKSGASEGAKIEDLLQKIALSHPEISFTFINSGKTKFSTSGNDDLKNTVFKLYGKDVYDRLLSLSYDDNGIKISGLIARPELNYATRDCEIFFVNKRLVVSKELSYSLENGFKGYLMQHKFPFGVIYVDVDPSTIDINVHPQKSEVRFSDIMTISEILSNVIHDALHEPELIPSVSLDLTKHFQSIDTPKTVELVDTPKSDYREEYSEPIIKPIIHEPVHIEPFEINKIRERALDEVSIETSDLKYTQQNLFEEKLIDNTTTKDYKIIGQIFDTYWLITLNDNLYIVDQHAAHEKVNYEKFLKLYEATEEAVTQYINPPIVMHLSGKEEITLKENMSLFSKVGFEIDEFGEKSYAIRGIPMEMFGNTPDDMFKRLLYELNEHEKITNPEFVLEKLASMSCKAAIKGGMKVSYDEMNNLMNQLMSLENPYNCPHGRPVFILITKTELEKKFKRIV